MSLFRNHKLKQLNSEQWMMYFAKMVFQQAFFDVIKTPKKSSLQVVYCVLSMKYLFCFSFQYLQLQVAAPPISNDVHQVLQQRFVNMLVELATSQPVIEKGIM